MQHLDHLSDTQQSLVLDLISRTTHHDGTPPIAEHILLHLRYGGDKADSHLLVEKDNQVIGYAHLDQTDLVAGPCVELVVDPSYRGAGVGKELLSEARHAQQLAAHHQDQLQPLSTLKRLIAVFAIGDLNVAMCYRLIYFS